MLSRYFYYTLKPYLPWSMRMALRRITARRKREQKKDVWPIDELAGRKPEHWPGWPDDKRFAFVLTHDVEGPEGLAKCRQLAELEMELGFRSVFNFIPEGLYTVPAELRTWLTARGFEVGVHDLNHDGRLFRSRSDFKEKAIRINRYIHEWGATGFRAGFMLRNLDWLHDLDIGYDASTFDTDPFEPQSDGAGTIFPFWVPSENTRPRSGEDAVNGAQTTLGHDPADDNAESKSGGYWELPYTLPQDSTLYLVLQEKTPEIWIRKLDWIAEQGGMALSNVHPDYVRFPGEPVTGRTYSVEHYQAFLRHVRERHGERFWHAPPRDVAKFAAKLDSRPPLPRSKRVCMITHSFYESDNRVTRYAEALASRGDHVDVLALRSVAELPRTETINGVNVFRIQNRFGKAQRSKFAYLWPLIRFLFTSSGQVTRDHALHHYDLVHVHNMPDFLVFAAWYPKLTGARVLLDIHDIVPEFYSSKFTSGRKGLTFGLLKWIERRAARFADHVIISNHLWRDTFAKRTGTENCCSVFINNVDAETFRPDLHTRHDNKPIILFPGGLQWHQGVDIALHAFARVNRKIPDAEFHIYGDGIMKPSLVALASELGLNGNVKFFAPVRITEIAKIMANATLGVVPKRADSFGNEAYSTKIMEFMSLGVPVVVSKTKIDQFYFNDSVVRFFESGNVDALSDAILDVLGQPDLRRQLIDNAVAYSQKNSWASRRSDYLTLIDSL